MKIDTSAYKVNGKKFKLSDFKTKEKVEIEKSESAEMLSQMKAELFEWQEKLYAEDKRSVLIIFQAMDAAGKDSAIENVMSGLNPQGCQVYSFKQPTNQEYDHDFLWRHYKALPEKGRFGIHNRSHYENVLICKVHPEIILKEKLPHIKDIKDINKDFWENRYQSIKNFEKHLSENGTVIIKFFLYVSKEEQKKRFLERIDDVHKNWKFSSFDIEERKHWDNYMNAYEDAITNTSSDNTPWYIIPADRKWHARLLICKILNETMEKLNPQFPMLSEEEKSKLNTCKLILSEEKDKS
jgi:PPK2 family polyphosphate:nucleotide phosphotransferase